MKNLFTFLLKNMEMKILPLVFFSLCSLTSFAQPGSLDNTFDTDGKLTTAIGTSNDECRSVAIQSDGKILVAGSSENGFEDDFAVARYNSNGTLDTTFDSDGKVTTSIGANYDFGNSIAIQSDGKILVAGCSSNGFDYDFAVVRYNSDGSLDNTFDSDGKVTTDFGANYDYGLSVAIQSDGKILVAGATYGSSDGDFALVRYNSNGSLDTTFDSDGKLTTPIETSYDGGYSATIQSDGKILVAGYSWNGFDNDFAIVRYTSNGSLDTTFDSDGKVTTDFGANYDDGFSVAVQSDGKILVAGRSWNGSYYDLAVVRYNNNGSLDNTFDTDGKVITPIGTGYNYGTSVAIQSDGKILVAGFLSNGSGYDFALVRYNSDGSLDNTFDTDGKVTTNIGVGDDYGYSAAIQSDGKIVVAGMSWNGTDDDFAVVRYNVTLIGLYESYVNNSLVIYPNPFSTKTVLQLDQTLHNATLIVNNCFGQTVAQIKNINGQSVVLHRENLPSGIYFVRLTENNKILAVKKLIIVDN